MRHTIAVLLLVVAQLQGANAIAKAKRPVARKSDQSAAQVQQYLKEAKAALLQGNRKASLELLEQARLLSRNTSEIKEVTSKRVLFAEQFLTSEAFQAYQETKHLAERERWDECLRNINSVGEKDKDNLNVLRLRAECQMGLKQFADASRTLSEVTLVVPDDVKARLDQVEIAVLEKRTDHGFAMLGAADPKSSPDQERFVILKARLLEQAGKPEAAEELLREDQEKHLDHVTVIHELGMLYTRMAGHDWPARKFLSLFITRCKRLKEAELKARKLDLLLPQAQATLAEIDKRLGV